MNKYRTLFLLIVIIVCSACAPRYIERRPSPRSQKRIVQKSLDIIKKVERENRDFRLSKIFYPIKAYLGTPYKFGGDNRRGMDCSGFSSRVFQESFKMKLPHNASQQYLRSTHISRLDLKLGDLVFFSMNQNGSIGHVGIYIGNNYFVHASTSYGVVVSGLKEKYYRSRYVGAGRVLN
jgi:cell wall-associated NlpC family hydrolase